MGVAVPGKDIPAIRKNSILEYPLSLGVLGFGSLRSERGKLGLTHVRPREPDRVAHLAPFSRYHAIVRSSPSSSSIAASNPSSVCAFATFGMRSSTSV